MAKASARTASPKNTATRDGRLTRLQMLVDEGREESEFLRGQVERGRHEVEVLRARVLLAARGGPICARCTQEIVEARASVNMTTAQQPAPVLGAVPAPAALEQPEPAASPPPVTASHLGSYPKERAEKPHHLRGWDPRCRACLARTCDGLDRLPCPEGGGPAVATL
jgi:hypothetical protein